MSRSAPLSVRLIIGLILGSLTPLAGTLAASAEPGRTSAPFGGKYIVVLDEAVAKPGAIADRLAAVEGFTTSLRFRHALEGFAARMSPEQVKALRGDPRVALVTSDRVVHASAMAPLASGDAAPTGVRRIEASWSGQVHAPSSVNVAVIDSGVDLSHPDLNAADGKNCVTGGPAIDDNGHERTSRERLPRATTGAASPGWPPARRSSP